MKMYVIALAVAATTFGAIAAHAQTTVITTEKPAVTVTPDTSTTVTTKERTGPLGLDSKTTTTTTGSGATGDCTSKTVHKDSALGVSKTVSKTDCP